MRTKAGPPSYFFRNVQVHLGYRPWCRAVGGLLVACFKLEAFPAAQSLVWTAETGVTPREGIWWGRWRHFESCKRKVFQALGLGWGDGKDFGALLYPAGNIQEDKIKKLFPPRRLQIYGRVTPSTNFSMPILEGALHNLVPRPCSLAWPLQASGMAADGEAAGPAPAPQSRTLSSQTSPDPIAHGAFALRITHGISCKHHQHLRL